LRARIASRKWWPENRGKKIVARKWGSAMEAIEAFLSFDGFREKSKTIKN
jgi:hypothetical protein